MKTIFQWLKKKGLMPVVVVIFCLSVGVPVSIKFWFQPEAKREEADQARMMIEQWNARCFKWETVYGPLNTIARFCYARTSDKAFKSLNDILDKLDGYYSYNNPDGRLVFINHDADDVYNSTNYEYNKTLLQTRIAMRHLLGDSLLDSSDANFQNIERIRNSPDLEKMVLGLSIELDSNSADLYLDTLLWEELSKIAMVYRNDHNTGFYSENQLYESAYSSGEYFIHHLEVGSVHLTNAEVSAVLSGLTVRDINWNP